MTEPLLRCRDLHKTYRIGKKPIPVLCGIDLDIRAGETLAITGASGSGKSTLLYLLGCLDRPTSGDIEYGGVSLDALSEPPRPIRRWRLVWALLLLPAGVGGVAAILAAAWGWVTLLGGGVLGLALLIGFTPHILRYRAHRAFQSRRIGFVFQSFHLVPELTALDNILLADRATRLLGRVRRGSTDRARQLAQLLGLGDRLAHRPMELSGGEQQRVAIARALLNRPEILLADEPTGNLDEATGQGILAALFDAVREHRTALVVVTHNAQIAALCDRQLHLEDGRFGPT